MTSTKPKSMWHADGEGKCHDGCEAFSRSDAAKSYNVCNALAVLPWAPRTRQSLGDPCPFAVLADVLCDAKPHEEKPNPQPNNNRGCDTCGNTKPGREAGTTDCTAPLGQRGMHVDGPGSCSPCEAWRPKPDEDRRCGTCALSSKPEDCAWIQSTTRPDGPPWPDCRFWRKR